MSSKDFRWWFLPYCLEEVKQGYYAVLNRGYKPVGMVTEEWVEYEGHAVKIEMSPEIAASLSHDKNPDIKRIYFYDDGSAPTASTKNMEIYLSKLATLAPYNITV